MAARRFLVTGGAGFIGSHLVAALLQRGDEVVALDNLSTGSLTRLEPLADQIRFVQGDINDRSTLDSALAGVDCVFHQAALPSVPLSVERPLDTHQHCCTGTLQLLHAAVAAKVRRVVYASSSSLYGDQPQPIKRETDLPAPISPYAVAKLSGEMYAHAFHRSYGLESVGLRYFNVFGPGQNPDSPYAAVIPRFITAMLAGQPPVVYGDGRQSRDFTHVDNVVRANLLAADAAAAAGRSMNIACGQSASLLELIETLNGLLGMSLAPAFEPPRPGDVRDSRADVSLAREVIGYEPHVPLQQGLEQTIDYYRRQQGG